MEKVVKKNQDSQKSDLEYWLSKSPAERFSCVEFLRRQYCENPGRLQRVVKVVQRK